jgi:hypothetical protein
LEVSAWLVAVTVRVCPAVIVGGAVYKPVRSIVPAPEGVTDQVTGSFAENCCVCPSYSVALVGVTLRTGNNVTVAEADFVVSAVLVAVMVTDCCVVIVAGAVYNPVLLIVPAPDGLTVHVTAWLAVNCCV